MILKDKDKKQFADEGFLILRNFVSLNEIDSLLKNVNSAVFGEQHENYGALRKDKRFDSKKDLDSVVSIIFDKQISKLGEELLEDGNKFIDAQYSVMQSGRPASKGWHIDGTWIATDKNSMEGIPFFKLLVGVYLTDISKPDHGNLMVSPKGHKIVADFFKKSGIGICKNPKEAFNALYKEPIPEMISIFAKPGDVVLAHTLLPHTVSDNKGPDRPVVYFRLGDYKRSGFSALSELWSEWPIWYRNTDA